MASPGSDREMISFGCEGAEVLEAAFGCVFQLNHDSFQHLEIVDPLDRGQMVCLKNGDKRLESYFVEGGLETFQAAFRGPHMLQYPMLEGDILDFAGVPSSCQIAQQSSVQSSSEQFCHALDFFR